MRIKSLIFAIALLATTVPLAGCLTLDQLTGGRLSLLTVGITNPIGPDQQYEIEGAVVVARRAAVEYFRLPQCRRTQVPTVQNPCAKRSIKVRIQNADRRLEIVLKDYRKFLAENPATIDAASAAQAVWTLLGELRATITSAGVN